MLEQTNGVAIAVVKVADACFLIGRRKGDGSSAGRQTPAYRHARDDRREVGLVEVKDGGLVVGRRNTSLLAGDRLSQIPGTEPQEGPDAASDQEDERDDEAANSSGCSGLHMHSVRVQLGVQFNSAALPATHLDGACH